MCKDRGVVFIDNNTVRHCECIQRRKVERLFKASKITEEFQKINFTSFETEDRPEIVLESKILATEYFKAFDRVKHTRKNSLAILGQPGAGKTHLLIAVANNLIRRKQQNVLYFPYREGFDEIKDDLDQAEAKMQQMKEVDVLFIDDLFKRGPTDYELKQMYSVINARYLNHKPILVSSEWYVDDLLEIDEALGSRIFQMVSDYYREIKGDKWKLNYRLASAAN